MRAILILCIGLSFPVVMIAQAFMLRQLFTTSPVAVSVVVFVAHVIALLALACLIDSRATQTRR